MSDTQKASDLTQSTLGKFSRYQIIEEVERGGMGIVYSARDRVTGSKVAVKAMLDTNNPRALDRFKQEARILTALDHNNIVKVNDYGLVEDRPFMVMDFIEGRELKAIVDEAVQKTGEVPDFSWTAKVLTKIAEALCYCHGRGAVHRDIKPSNILIEDADERPVLIDFGLVKKNPEIAGTSIEDMVMSLSQSRDMIGSPPFMSPEQIHAKKFGVVGPESDVWAFGSTLFYCLTGKSPYGDLELTQFYTKRLTEEPPAPKSINPQVPAWLNDICCECHRFDPPQRPEMDNVLARLQNRPQDRKPASGAVKYAVIAAMSIALGLFIGLHSQDFKSDRLTAQSAVSLSTTTVSGYTGTKAFLELNGTVVFSGLVGGFAKTIQLQAGFNKLQMISIIDEKRTIIGNQVIICDLDDPKVVIEGRARPQLFVTEDVIGAVSDETPVTILLDNKIVTANREGQIQLRKLSAGKHILECKDSVGHATRRELIVVPDERCEEILRDLNDWSRSTKSLQDKAIQSVGQKLSPQAAMMRVASYQVGERAHRIATFVVGKIGVCLQLIPGGKVRLRERTFQIEPFLIGTYELRQIEWLRSPIDTKQQAPRFKGLENPVDSMSYKQIGQWLRAAKRGLRLPTEAEWSWAARAGSKAKFASKPNEVARSVWGRENSGARTHCVFAHSEFRNNAFGLVDTRGNVSELCQLVSAMGGEAPYLGTSYMDSIAMTDRGGKLPVEGRYSNLGFRVAMSIPK
jgi:serine/threonine protein kinase